MMSSRLSRGVMKYFYSPLLVSIIFILAAFWLYFASSLNLFGIAVFFVFAVVFNVFWVAFFAFLMDRQIGSVSWLWIYFAWLVSVVFFVWVMYDKLLVDMNFYRDMVVLALGGAFFFRAIENKKWLIFALGLVTAYLYYASFHSKVLFVVLLFWLIIDGLVLDNYVSKSLSAGKLVLCFFLGVVYFALAIVVMGVLKDWIF